MIRFSDGQSVQSIGAVAVAPSNPDVIYVGTGEGNPRNEKHLWAGVLGDPFGDSPASGLFRSRDGGLGWERVLFANERTGIADFVADPANPTAASVSRWRRRGAAVSTR